MLRMNYFTIFHFLSLLVISISLYLIFMWASNFLNLGWTQYAVLASHQAPIFYLIMSFTIGTCVLLDYCLLSYRILIKTTPISFLRLIVSQKESIETESNRARFMAILSEIEKKAQLKESKRLIVTNMRNS